MRAASSGVFPPSASSGSSPSPSRITYRIRLRAIIVGLLRGLHDCRELGRLQRRPSDQCAVDVGLRHQRLRVARLHAAPVEDADVVGDVVPRRPACDDAADVRDRVSARRPGSPSCPSRSPRSVRTRSTVSLDLLRLQAASPAVICRSTFAWSRPPRARPRSRRNRRSGRARSAKATLTFVFTPSSVSPNSSRRSECPRIT